MRLYLFLFVFFIFFSFSIFSCFDKKKSNFLEIENPINKVEKKYKFGVVTVDRLRLRSSNDIHSKTYKFLDKGDIVEIISKEDKIVTIDENISGNWYYVNFGEITGWVFGYYLQLAEDYNEAMVINKNITGKVSNIDENTKKSIEDYINSNFYFISEGFIYKVKDISKGIFEKINLQIFVTSFAIDNNNNFWIVGIKNNDKNLYYYTFSDKELKLIHKNVNKIEYINDKNILIFVNYETNNKQNIYNIKYLLDGKISNLVKLKFNNINLKDENYEKIIEMDRGSLINIDFDKEKNLIIFKTYEDQYNYLISLVDNSYIKTLYTKENEIQLDRSKTLKVENQIDQNDKTKMNYSIIIHNSINGISKTIYQSQKYPITFIKSPLNELLSVTFINKNEDQYETEIKIFSIFDDLIYTIKLEKNVFYPYWQ